MKLSELLKNTDIVCEKSQENIEITGVSYDSRHTRPEMSSSVSEDLRATGMRLPALHSRREQPLSSRKRLCPISGFR